MTAAICDRDTLAAAGALPDPNVGKEYGLRASARDHDSVVARRRFNAHVGEARAYVVRSRARTIIKRHGALDNWLHVVFDGADYLSMRRHRDVPSVHARQHYNRTRIAMRFSLRTYARI